MCKNDFQYAIFREKQNGLKIENERCSIFCENKNKTDDKKSA